MAKRFTATEKWDDPWFRSLPSKYKCLWQFILDKCDNAGVWKKDFAMAEYCTSEKFIEADAFGFFNTDKIRVVVLNGGSYWLIKDFVPFQFGRLSPSCKPHIPILDLIEKHRNSKGYPKGIHTLEEKEKEKEQEKEKDVQPKPFVPWLEKAEYKTLRMLFNKEDDLVRHLEGRGFNLADAKGLAVEILQGAA